MQSPTLSELQTVYQRKALPVGAQISPEDSMWEDDRDRYFAVGHSALLCVKLAMLAAGKSDVRRVLDFACGHGRVLRTLKAAFPQARLAACDISRAAVDFCAKTFGATPIYSEADPGQIRIQERFDLIWCGSLLTHVNHSRFVRFLKLFRSILSPGGVLLFSTHGRRTSERLRGTEAKYYGLEPRAIGGLLSDYEREGFGYRDHCDEELASIGMKNYGVSVCSPSWVCFQLQKLSGLRLLTYTERGWDDHQDAIACVRNKD